MTFTPPTFDSNGQPYSLDLSPFYPGGKVIAPEPGRFILPANAVYTTRDFYWHKQDARWRLQNHSGNGYTVLDDSNKYPSLIAHSRLITDDPTLYARMQAYAKGVVPSTLSSDPAILVATVGKLKTELAAAEEALAAAVKERDEMKVGDWLVNQDETSNGSCDHLAVGEMVRVHSVDPQSPSCWRIEGSNIGWSKHRFRRATPTEIAAHLAKLEEAKVEAGRVTIVVDGKPYVADFTTNRGTVTFGCARISNALILIAESTLRFGAGHGNRVAESIYLGKGRFDLATLTKMLPLLKD